MLQATAESRYLPATVWHSKGFSSCSSRPSCSSCPSFGAPTRRSSRLKQFWSEASLPS